MAGAAIDRNSDSFETPRDDFKEEERRDDDRYSPHEDRVSAGGHVVDGAVKVNAEAGGGAEKSEREE